jgi:alpha-mannosidase
VRVSVPERWEGAVVTREGQPLPVYEVAATDRGTEICFLSGEVPAFGAATVRVAALAPCRLAAQGRGNAPCTGGRFTATPAEHGITDLAVTGLGPVTDPAKYLLGELILEADHGGPWATFSPDRPRTRLGPLARLEGVRAHGDSVAITYGGAHPGGDDLFAPLLRWRQIFRLREGLAWLEVETTVEWYTIGCRLRLAFPSTTRLNRGVYEIPCGVLGRDRYDAPNDWFQSCGDWPALHWAGIQAPDHVFAVFNRGTPSYRVEDGTILVSVLRSPRWFMAETPRQAVPLENDDFAARHYDGRLDHGTHTFHHALYVTPGEWRESDVAGQAHLFNAGLHVQPCELAGTLPAWRLEARHTSVAAVKQAEDGQGLVVRLVEHAGRPETVRLHVPAPWRSAWQANLLEDKWRALDVAGGAVEVEMQPWKIVTLRLEG